MSLEKIINVAVKVLDEKKAVDITAVEIGELTVAAECFVIATATSNTHVKALADYVEDALTKAGYEPNHIEGKATNWILLDYSGVVIHIFTKESREYYNLDKMWDDGNKLDVKSILSLSEEEK